MEGQGQEANQQLVSVRTVVYPEHEHWNLGRNFLKNRQERSSMGEKQFDCSVELAKVSPFGNLTSDLNLQQTMVDTNLASKAERNPELFFSG